MPDAVAVLLVLLVAIVVAVPLRRLWLDGRSRGAILAYGIVLLALALAVTELRPLARYLLPILFLAYLLPFVTWRGGLDRLLGRRDEVRVTRPEPSAIAEPRNVTPPDPGQARDRDEGHDEPPAPPRPPTG